MKIVFLNVLDAELTEPLKEFLLAHRDTTDVFCFQEVYSNMQGLIKELLADFAQVTASKPEQGASDSFCNATLVRSTLIVEASGSNSDLLGIGLALHATVRHKGALVHIVNVHGNPRPGKLDNPERIQQSREILSMLETAQGVKIIGGDLNVLLDTQSVRMFEEAGYKNLIRDFDIKTTRNHIAWNKHPGNELYHSDYVFVKGASVPSFEVPSQIVSDHQPMIVTLDLD